ncbi:hypothetical protein B0J13DRAFT_196494 [Dactylonectria estremocensis]|uniref:Uncharacterized protein n=1 Tax=Dactylonectria estremocensis TaxID=1079267 RepID=A0A9P9IFC8_9HYPO|nr:hypothetical protein B0J13DRAFT_196494 [Dactylonectria estremocensis]
MKTPSDQTYILLDDTSTITSGLFTPEDTSTIASSRHTPNATPSERGHVDGAGSGGSDAWTTESPTTDDSEPEASDLPRSRLYQTYQKPHNRRRVRDRRRKISNRKGFNLFNILVSVAILSVAAISWWMRSWGSSSVQPRANPIDDFIASQDDWIAVNDIITEYDYLPEDIKSRETTMTDMMLAVKHSNLPSRHRLVREMKQFSVVADRVVDDLIDWTSLAAATVDRIQNMNYHALLGYQSLQEMGSWTAIPAPDAEDVGLIPTFQHFGHIISVALVGDRRQKSITLHQLFVQEADKAGSQLNLLKVQGTSLAKDFRKMSNHLGIIADISRSEEAQLKSEERQLKSSVRGWMGLNSCAAEDLKTQAEELCVMAQRMMEGREMMKGATMKIRKLDKGFGKLYLALAEGRWEEADAIPWRLATIQSAVNRLEGVRESTRPRVARSRQQTI